jgi:hypothetical protein
MESGAEMRIFSIPEANEAVKKLRQTLPGLRRSLRRIEKLENRLEVLDLICNRSVSADNPDLQEMIAERLRYHREISDVDRRLAGMERDGYLLRDLDRGIVHFMGTRGGQQVLLCWREGEPAICHWHPLNGQRVPDESERRRIEESEF